MRKFTFTIEGNQESKTGNPIPYFRTTQGSKFSKGAMRYADWKEHVKGSFLAHCIDMGYLNHQDFKALIYVLPDMKPIVKSKNKIRMDIHSTFIDDSHADSDNIFKGIADALFQNDKYLEGSFTFERGDKGKVEVKISM